MDHLQTFTLCRSDDIVRISSNIQELKNKQAASKVKNSKNNFR